MADSYRGQQERQIMRGVTQFIKDHQLRLMNRAYDNEFISFHLTQISFLQHERLVHLIVMLFVFLFTLIFLVLFLTIKLSAFLIVFLLLLILSIFYLFHYYKLENSVIEWYFVYNEKMKGKED